MTSKIVVNNIEPDAGISTVTVNGDCQATTFKGALTGTASGNPTLTNGSNDRIVTATGANALNGEANLTFETSTSGGTLTVAGTSEYQIKLKDSNTSGNGAETALAFTDSGNTIQGFVGYNYWGDGNLDIQNNNSGGSVCINTGGGNERLRIQSDGDVGIGTDSVLGDTKVHIYDTSTSNYRSLAIDSYATNGSTLIYKQNGSQVISIGSGGGNNLSGSNVTHGLIRSEVATVFAVGNNERLRIESSGNLLLQPSNPGSSSFYPYMSILNGQIKKYMQVKILNSGEGTKFTFTGTDRTSALITIKVSHSWTASNTSNRHGSAIYAVRIFTANGGSAGWDGITLIQAYGYSTSNFILSNESGYGYSIKVNNPLGDSGISFCYDIEVMSASNTSKHSLTSVAVV